MGKAMSARWSPCTCPNSLLPTLNSVPPNLWGSPSTSSHREILATIFFWAPATVKPEPSSLRYEVTGLPPSGGPPAGLDVFQAESNQKAEDSEERRRHHGGLEPCHNPRSCGRSGPGRGWVERSRNGKKYR